MADLVISASNVAAVSTVASQRGTASETIDAGETVYLHAATNTIKLAKNATEAEADCLGIALNTAYNGQPIDYIGAGQSVTVGSVVTVGEIYVVSATAGKIAPEGDLASTHYVTILGVGTAANTIKLICDASGVQVP